MGLPAASWWRLHWTLAWAGRHQRSSQHVARQAREEGDSCSSMEDVKTDFEDLQQKIGTLNEALKQENRWTRKLILVTFSIMVMLIVVVAGIGVLGAITFRKTQDHHHNHTTY